MKSVRKNAGGPQTTRVVLKTWGIVGAKLRYSEQPREIVVRSVVPPTCFVKILCLAPLRQTQPSISTNSRCSFVSIASHRPKSKSGSDESLSACSNSWTIRLLLVCGSRSDRKSCQSLR